MVGQSLGSSPRLWGCFRPHELFCTVPAVFPTPVGVFPRQFRLWGILGSLPHACGGVSTATVTKFAVESSSPRLWGCFLARCKETMGRTVFPTPVGVFPYSCGVVTRTSGLPHACGGVSNHNVATFCVLVSSPRLWGCFDSLAEVVSGGTVFPTPVGVFQSRRPERTSLLSLPHACGGVSITGAFSRGSARSSPRLWGCFHRLQHCERPGTVFPTPVGVFLYWRAKRQKTLCLPHACGGVSSVSERGLDSVLSSPRLWGCFLSTSVLTVTE